MDYRAKIEDLKRAVEMGRSALEQTQKLIAVLEGAEDAQATIALARRKLHALQHVHAEDLAELKRLTTH